MTVKVERVPNNDPRLDLGIPVLDLYIDDSLLGSNIEVTRVLHHLSRLPSYEWLDRCNAHVLFDERWDPDLDTMVLVCVAVVGDEDRVWHSMSSDGHVPMSWELNDGDATP